VYYFDVGKKFAFSSIPDVDGVLITGRFTTLTIVSTIEHNNLTSLFPRIGERKQALFPRNSFY
jgi:hypothetical protein